MNNCDHKKLKTAQIKKEFLGHTFSADAKICAECGAELWNNSLNNKFHDWINNLEIDNQKQYKISANTAILLQQLGTQFHCSDESKLVRSIIAVFNKKISNPHYSEVINNIMDSHDFKVLDKEPTTVSKKVRITNPKSIYDIENWKEILGMNDSEFIRTYVLLILVMSKQSHNKFATFWNDFMKDDLEMVLAA